jgi:hypothetical protein
MKIFIRTLYKEPVRPLWWSSHQREELRQYLNDLGFYVLTGAGDSLEVYAIYDEKPLESVILKEVIEKIGNFWYAYKRRKHEKE